MYTQTSEHMHAQTHAHTHTWQMILMLLWLLLVPVITVLPASASGVSGQCPAASPGGAHAPEPAAAVPTGHTQDREWGGECAPWEEEVRVLPGRRWTCSLGERGECAFWEVSIIPGRRWGCSMGGDEKLPGRRWGAPWEEVSVLPAPLGSELTPKLEDILTRPQHHCHSEGLLAVPFTIMIPTDSSQRISARVLMPL